MKSQDLKISDEVISHLAKIIQLGILSGTDIVDHMRMIRLQESEEDTLVQFFGEGSFKMRISTAYCKGKLCFLKHCSVRFEGSFGNSFGRD